MVPDITYEYARQRFRQMLLEGTGYGLAQEWRHLFLKRYETSSAQDSSNSSCSIADRKPVVQALQLPTI